MNKISSRLLSIASCVSGRVVADVGCDHGKLVCHLFDQNKINFAYISDISAPSLNKAEDLLDSRRYKYRSICCDGLNSYNGINDIDECIISGMGGDEIIKIISSSPISINSYILSPQHNIIEVKRFMIDNNYMITKDYIIKDKNKFYNIIKFEKCEEKATLSDFDLYFGKDNFTSKSQDFVEYIDYNIRKINNMLDKVTGDNKIKYENYLKLLHQAKKGIGYE